MQSSKLPATTFKGMFDLLGHAMTEEEMEMWKKENFVFADMALDDRGLPGFVVRKNDES